MLRRRRARQPDSLLSIQEDLTASAVAALITDMRAWVHRRVESAQIIDDVAVIRRSSIDLTVPEVLDEVPFPIGPALEAVGTGIIPISFLKKERLRNFDLHDEEGRPLPMLSRRDNGRLATNVLVSQAEAVLRGPLPPEMQGPLHDVAEDGPSEALEALWNWGRYATDPRHPQQSQWAQLTSRDGFMDLAFALIDTFIVCAITNPSPGKRRILKLSYEEPFGDENRRFLAWRWKALAFDASQSRLADSYHFELAAPADMEAFGGLLHFEPVSGSQDPPPLDDSDIPRGQLVHLYTTSVPSGADATAYVWLRARQQGNLRAAMLTGALSAVLLWLGYLDLDDIADPNRSQVSAALLLLGPTLLAAALVRPGEHRLVTGIFFWVRILTVGCMLSLLLAVGLLAGAAESARHSIWLGAAIFASVCSVGLLAAYFFPRMPQPPE